MKTIKNLTLRKETVASLDGREMGQLKGGNGLVSVADGMCASVTCLGCAPDSYGDPKTCVGGTGAAVGSGVGNGGLPAGYTNGCYPPLNTTVCTVTCPTGYNCY